MENNFLNRKLLIFWTVFLTVALLASCSKKSSEDKKRKDSSKITKVYVVNPILSPFAETSTYYAPILPEIMQPIFTPIAGTVVSYPALAGQKVKKGQVIALIKPAGIDGDRNLMKLFAPIAGIVMDLPITKGDLATANTKIADIYQPGSFTATLQLASADTLHIKSESLAQLSVGKISTEAKVLSVSPYINPKLGTQRSVIRIEDTEGLLPGQLAQFIFKYNQRESYKVPLAAIRSEGKTHYLYVVSKDSTLSRLTIDPGQKAGKFQEIKGKGLSGKLSIVSKSSSRRLQDKQKVSIVSDKKTPGPQKKVPPREAKKRQARRHK